MKIRAKIALFGVLVAGCSSNAALDGSVQHDGSEASVDAAVSDAINQPHDAATTHDASNPRDAMVVMGGPGCGLPAAAFCDTFDAPTATAHQGRSGDLDARYWSASRFDSLGLGEFGPTNGQAFAIAGATLLPTRNLNGTMSTLPACRAGLPTQVFADQDTLICDPSTDIHSGYLLTAVAAQNYGENSYRIRQPFDFEGRTGKVVFDAEAFTLGGLWGYISLDVTEDPTPAPAFSDGVGADHPFVNNEGTAIPRNGFELQFVNMCFAERTVFGLHAVHVFNDYHDTVTNTENDGHNPGSACVPMAWGKLNHFEVDVSQTEIAVYASPNSDDGVTFAPTQLLYRAAVNLPFTRGYVHVTVHNHAALKYTSPPMWGNQVGFNVVDAWMTRWDNVGFDGPVISNWREYEVAEPRTLITVTENNGTVDHGMNTGWVVRDVSENMPTAITIHGVDLANATSAILSFNSLYQVTDAAGLAQYSLRYRINGGAWRDRMFNAGELYYLTSGGSQGALAQTIDIPIGDLVAGDNTVEFESTHAVNPGYPVGIVNVDLVVGTP